MGIYFGPDGTLCPFLGEECMTTDCALYSRDGEGCAAHDVATAVDYYGDEMESSIAFLTDVLLAIAGKLGADLSHLEYRPDTLIVPKGLEPAAVGVVVGHGPVPIAEFWAWWNGGGEVGENEE